MIFSIALGPKLCLGPQFREARLRLDASSSMTNAKRSFEDDRAQAELAHEGNFLLRASRVACYPRRRS
jgi:hypothetical protein